MATIDEVFAEFLDEQRARLSDRTYQQYEKVIELFAMSMNGYGPNALTDDEFARWEQRMDVDETSAFTGLFGPDKIPLVDLVWRMDSLTARSRSRRST